MLGLSLRPEFQGRRVRGSSTAIELTRDDLTGATQLPAQSFLEITYPTSDVLAALEAIGPTKGRPVVLIGERGQGKSHLLGVLYHALNSPEVAKAWLAEWAQRLDNSRIAALDSRSSMHIIGESLHRHSFKYLWDLVLDRHPHGPYVRGKWEALGPLKTDVPSHSLLLELFTHTPTALILDEFQTWFDGLLDSPQRMLRQWAFNFVQLLSEIAGEHPDRLLLVVSVRNGDTEAFQQIHRVNPALVDFKGPQARQDRRRLLLHRLFQNRLQIARNDIQTEIAAHVEEAFRLLEVPPSEHDRTRHEFIEAWPFSPHLIHLLEDQVLVATNAQETRDLILILADLYKGRGDQGPLLTAADFRVDDEHSTINSLLDSVANPHHSALREKAMRNLASVRDAAPAEQVPHLSELVGSLWLRSLAVAKSAGAEPATLQVDITRSRRIDDNQFAAELSTLVGNSFNIHREGLRYIFREEENAEARLRSSARNDKLFANGSDRDLLRKEMAWVIGGADTMAASVYRVIALPRTWRKEPWLGLESNESPEEWDTDRIPVLIVPESLAKPGANLGPWLKEHLTRRRNGVRFLLASDGTSPVYTDPDLISLARMIVLANLWKADTPEYKKLSSTFETELRTVLKTRFDRLALLDVWNFPQPEKCEFSVLAHKSTGTKIPEAVDTLIAKNLFVPEDFEEFVIQAARDGDSMGKVLQDLQEPRPNGEPCIPWLGMTAMRERIGRLCAQGKIAISVRNQEHLQAKQGEDEEATWQRIRTRLPVGRYMSDSYLMLPQAVPSSTIALPSVMGQGAEPHQGHRPPASGQPESEEHVDPSLGLQPPIDNPFTASMRFAEHSAPATSSLNLLAKVKDNWNINTGTQVRHLILRTDALTGDQLERLLKNLPDGLQYELSLIKEDR